MLDPIIYELLMPYTLFNLYKLRSLPKMNARRAQSALCTTASLLQRTRSGSALEFTNTNKRREETLLPRIGDVRSSGTFGLASTLQWLICNCILLYIACVCVCVRIYIYIYICVCVCE